jgi:GT2 family glycosyltransferase
MSSQVRVFRSRVNLGFGAANNLAIQAAEGRYIILLNSDAFLCPGLLRAAVDNMNLHPNTALARRATCGVASSATHLCLPVFRPDSQKTHFFGYFDRTWADPSEPAQVDWVAGAFSIVRAKVLGEVGLFDPRFFLYSEEVDLRCRIKNAGYEIWYWPDILVIHIGGIIPSNQRP